VRRADNLHVPIVLKSGSPNLLEPSGPVQGLCRDCPSFTFTFRRNNPVPDEERFTSDIVILSWSSAFPEAICRIVQCKKFLMLPLFYIRFVVSLFA
jgi:hypothetical protein